MGINRVSRYAAHTQVVGIGLEIGRHLEGRSRERRTRVASCQSGKILRDGARTQTGVSSGGISRCSKEGVVHIIKAEACADRGLTIAEWIPGQPHIRGELRFPRIVKGPLARTASKIDCGVSKERLLDCLP